ncbi:MAG: 5-formyltetrahydrofolate cyclo-ligase, partial [Clostridiales bacterium]|nr:5-formyltetrahydrofolate cyclo-ligase [Clostridiales bacterium]
MYDKKMLRNEMRAKRNALSPEEIREKSAAITEKIIASEAFKNAKSLFTYISMQSEVHTYSLIRAAWRHGKRVAVPAVQRGEPEMRFFYIENFDNLVKSPFGVLEPTKGEQAVSDKNTLLIVPGLVFDKNMNRIGYGGGYYDRFMAKHPTLFNLAVCYAFQIVADLEPECWDVAVDGIVTEL